MPQIITLVSEAYRFDELDDAAKERARDWYREASAGDTYEFEHIIDDFIRVGEIIGIDFTTHTVNLHGGGTRQEPNIYWSGFCCQGDGACFEGVYDYKATAPTKIREHAPQDTELHRIADELSRIQAANTFGVRAFIVHRSSHYYHSRTMSIEVTDRRNEGRYDKALVIAEKDIGELMVDLADWLYKQLSDHNDYLYSTEHVDETIEANEYMFDEEGNRHDYA